MLLGFTWGGWMTSSTEQKMAEETTERARAELAAAFCVERFLSAADVRTQLASLKKEDAWKRNDVRSEEHTSELQSLMRISYAVLCSKKKKNHTHTYKK